MFDYLQRLTEAIRATNVATIEALGETLKDARVHDRRVFVCGNGGSHAVALHWGVDFPKLAHVNMYTLGTNQALHTALSNDLDYDVGLSTELIMYAHPEDVLIALSCSGRSKNIVAVLNEARKLHMRPYLITGPKAPEYPAIHTIRIMGTNDYGTLEDVFSVIGHYLTQEIGQ